MTAISLRPDQEFIFNNTRAAFGAGEQSVLVVSPTSSDKTVIFVPTVYEPRQSLPDLGIRHALNESNGVA